MIRYFLAVTPPEPLRGQIEKFRGRWNHPHHRVEPHITVKAPFLWPGNPAPVLKAVQDACARVQPFDVTLGQPGRFPRARVLFLSVRSAGLEPLHRVVLEALKTYTPTDPKSHEGGPYHPHLTLAAGRFGIDDAGLEAMEREAQAELSGLPSFEVPALRCYKLEPGMSRWHCFRDLPLGPAQ